MRVANPDRGVPSPTRLVEINSERGFDAATRTLMPALLRYARKLTRDTAAADDLVQDTLLRAWAARARFQPGTHLRAWLFRIARNTFLSSVRNARRNVAWNPDVHDKLMTSAPMQDDGIYQADFEQALRQLPPEQVKAFLMVTADDLPYAVAAEQLGIERGTLSSRVARARSTLRAQCLGDFRIEHHSVRAITIDSGSSPVSQPGHYQQWKASGCRMIG